MSTKALWRNNILEFYDPGLSYERVARMAPVQYYDDFLGAWTAIPAGGSEESGCDWADKIVLTIGSPTVAKVADAANGVVQCALDVTAEAQGAMLYHGDQRNFSLEQGLVFETRVKVSVLPTLVAEAVWGLAGDYAAGPDNVTYSLFFTADGSGEIFAEMDDNATDTSTTTGTTVLATAWHTYRIDVISASDVLFYIDGTQVLASTTYAYAATGANAILQPYFGCYKASGAGLGTIQVDYVKIWQNRS